MKWQNQPKFKLTLEMIEKGEPRAPIHTARGFIEHPWFNDAQTIKDGGNLEDDGESVLVKWVLYRGTVPDWCIYHSLDANLMHTNYLQGTGHLEKSYKTVMKHGGKLHNTEQIRALVDCDDEVMKLYRH